MRDRIKTFFGDTTNSSLDQDIKKTKLSCRPSTTQTLILPKLDYFLHWSEKEVNGIFKDVF